LKRRTFSRMASLESSTVGANAEVDVRRIERSLSLLTSLANA
jgi:hypothetical protein